MEQIKGLINLTLPPAGIGLGISATTQPVASVNLRTFVLWLCEVRGVLNDQGLSSPDHLKRVACVKLRTFVLWPREVRVVLNDQGLSCPDHLESLLYWILVLKLVHVQVTPWSPLGRRDMPQPGGYQHQTGPSGREVANNPSSPPDFTVHDFPRHCWSESVSSDSLERLRGKCFHWRHLPRFADHRPCFSCTAFTSFPLLNR